MTEPQALRATLRTLVGDAHVLTDGDLTAYEQDWRKRERGRALAVVRPGTTAEVAAVVSACAAAGVSLVPQGGNTGMVVGSIPDASGTQVLLSLQRLTASATLTRPTSPSRWKLAACCRRCKRRVRRKAFCSR